MAGEAMRPLCIALLLALATPAAAESDPIYEHEFGPQFSRHEAVCQPGQIAVCSRPPADLLFIPSSLRRVATWRVVLDIDVRSRPMCKCRRMETKRNVSVTCICIGDK